MTREEAIKDLHHLILKLKQADGDDRVYEYYKEAIETLQTEQNAYKEGYDACKRIMTREKQFNSYCPRCMGKLEPCEDCISRQEVNDLVDELARAISDERCNVLRKRSPAIIMHAILKLPSVQPEPFINKPCVSEQACHEDKVKVLEKIKADITAISINGQVDEHTLFIRTGEQVKQMALDIVDKYMAESEGK